LPSLEICFSHAAGISRARVPAPHIQNPQAIPFLHFTHRQYQEYWKQRLCSFYHCEVKSQGLPLPTATFRRYEYRRRLPHYQRDDRPLFVTFRTSTAYTLSPKARTLALQHCLHDQGKTIQIYAAVVMPNHVHLLFTALRDANGWTFALPEILRAIKGSSARSINKLTGRTGPVWQDESFDHVLRGDESLRETIEDICQNPVRKGLVQKSEDYRWLWFECGAGTPAREI
jgi:REP element-mobilizing transposase RayT